MKHAFFIFLWSSLFSLSSALGKTSPVHQDNTIYTAKVKRIVNALNVGEFSNQSDYIKQLKTACSNNNCTSIETQTVQSVGQQIVYCQIQHLRSHGIENPDAINLCGSEQAILACDSLSTPLMRKMCYTGNRYNLRTGQEKELKIQSRKRLPASRPQ